jgi:zinc transporter 1/2/3
MHALLHGQAISSSSMEKYGDKDSDSGDITPKYTAKQPRSDLEMGPLDRLGSSSGVRGRRPQQHQQPADGRTESAAGFTEPPDSVAATRAWAGERPPRTRVSLLTAVLMTVALTFHSLLEGAALGAARDMVHSAHIFVAIQAHKGLTAFALGCSLVESAAPPLQFWSLVLLMASATPVGIGVGLLVSGLTSSTGASAISAVAAGTFIYVAIVEILPKELADPEYKGLKVLMVFVGFGLMALLAVWA